MADLLTDDDAIRDVCRQHTFTVTPYLDFRGATVSEPVTFTVDCSCGGLHMSGTINEIMALIQADMRAHGAPVSQWWYRRHPDHPLEAGR
jgi:hypothetical protein